MGLKDVGVKGAAAGCVELRVLSWMGALQRADACCGTGTGSGLAAVHRARGALVALVLYMEQQRCMRLASLARCCVSSVEEAVWCRANSRLRRRGRGLFSSLHACAALGSSSRTTVHRPLGNSPPSPLVSLAVNIASSLSAIYLLWRRRVGWSHSAIIGSRTRPVSSSPHQASRHDVRYQHHATPLCPLLIPCSRDHPAEGRRGRRAGLVGTVPHAMEPQLTRAMQSRMAQDASVHPGPPG